MPVLRIVFLLLISATVSESAAQDLAGRWALDHEASTAIDPWRNLEVSIEMNDAELHLVRTWSSGPRRVYADSLQLRFDEPAQYSGLELPERGHLAAFPVPGSTRDVVARRQDGAPVFTIETRLPIGTAQGTHPVTILSEYELSEDQRTLTITERRSSRPTPLRFVLHRVEN